MLDYDVDTHGIATLSWDMTERAVNVMSPDARIALISRIDEVIADENVRGVIITSARDEFIAGADLTFLTSMRGGDPAEVMKTMSPMRDALRRLEKSGKPSVAAINGTALGAGLEICLACTHRIAADRPDAQLGLPEATLGLLPGAGGTQRLSRLIGVEKALDLILSGKRVSPAEAHKLGFVNDLVERDELLAAARTWILAQDGPCLQPWDQKGFVLPGHAADSMALHRYFVAKGAEVENATKNLSPAPQAILSSVFEGVRVPFDAGLAIEFTRFIGLLIGEVAQNTIRTMFFGVNEVRKLSSRPEGIKRFKPKKIGILGAGLMGSGIAEVASLAGIEVVLLDRDETSSTAGRDRVQATFDKQVKRGRMAQAAASDAMKLISATPDFTQLAGADAVIEAVFEDKAVKADITRKALEATGPDILFASNTSKILISSLAESSPRPDRFVGMHFFSPVGRMPLLELIRGKETSDETLAQAMDIGKLFKKMPIVVNDGPGFFTSRCVSSYMNEGLIMLSKGVPAALIENCGRLSGMPVGPLTLADEIGMDLMLQVRRQEQQDYDKAPGGEFETLKKMAEGKKRTGRKGGGGFYDYPAGEAKSLWSGVTETFGGTTVVDPEEISKRLLHVQALEAARCFDEGIIDSPRDADVGSVFGWSFAKHTGGVISYIDTYGLDAFVADCDGWKMDHGERYAVPTLLREMAQANKQFHI